MRAASPGREPRCSLPAKYRPASLLDASRNRELPLPRSSRLRAQGSHTARLCRALPCFLHLPPWLTQPPHPLCPPLSAGGQLTLGPSPSRVVERAPHQGSALRFLSLSRSQSQPSTPVPRLCPRSLGAGTGPLALLFCSEPRGGRGSPLPCPAALDLPVERLQSPLSFLWPLC